MTAVEVNFDGLVGPTHSYAGLSWGNVASQQHQHRVANPKAAALQGLEKMRQLSELGLVQGVLPPHERPHVPSLRALGFAGTDEQVLAGAAARAPRLLAAVSSASSMWTANAATVSASADTADTRVHFTPANLNAKFHRAIEYPSTTRALRAIFADPAHFSVHDALPACPHFGDEGAANHTRLCAAYDQPGVELYVYGCSALDDSAPRPHKYPARQTLEASEAVARRHGLMSERCVFAQQNPAVIDQGVFHNDVIAVGNRNVLLYHEEAFLDAGRVVQEINSKLAGTSLIALCIRSADLAVEEAVSTYLFNSQLVSLDDDRMALIVPQECRTSARASAVLDALLEDAGNPITQVIAMDLKQSMRNGGGPACLRLRVALTEAELKAVGRCIVTPTLLDSLESWVERHYRESLIMADLSDPALLQESRFALDELTALLKLGSIYDFQR